MPSEQGTALTAEERRLHPLSWLFRLGASARGLLLPVVVVLFASGGGRGTELWLAVLLVPAAISALVRQLVYRYRFGDGELVVRDGVVRRNERHIPYARIQNIDLAQNPIHRLLGVAQVRLETASGSEPEAVIRVLSLEAIEEMRTRVFRERDTEEAERTGEQLVSLTPREVVRYGLISNRGTVVVAAVFGLIWQLGRFEPERPGELPAWVQPLGGLVERFLAQPVMGEPWSAVLLTVAAFLAVVVLLRLLSVGLALVTLHRFTLVRRGEDLRAEYGWPTRVSATVPRPRIQLLSVRESFLHRRFGRLEVQVETAGGAPRGGGGEEEQGAREQKLWLAPVLAPSHLPTLLAEALPGVDLEAAEWQPLAPVARRRVLRKGLALAVGVSAVATAAAPPWGALVLPVLAPVAWLHARWWTARTAYALLPSAVAFRSGWWQRRLSVVRYGKMQVIALERNPFDRRLGMASVRVDTAGAGRVGHRVDIPYLEEGRAREVASRLIREVARTPFRW